jgi:hypothetical protein
MKRGCSYTVVWMTRWDEAVAGMTGKKYKHELFPEYMKRRQHLE